MARVYIDCGAWNGDSITAFKRKFIPDDPNAEIDIYAFECNPKYRDQLKIRSQLEKFTFIQKAVWVEDGKISLYLGTDDATQSSSLYIEKKKFIDKEKPIIVESIDFSYWIAGKFNASDNIICKMNIEGAEYDVLEKMVKDKTIDLINRLYVAWHFTKIENFSVKRHINLLRELKNRVRLFEWDFHEKNTDPFK
jgi:FkbM family methyltransferase